MNQQTGTKSGNRMGGFLLRACVLFSPVPLLKAAERTGSWPEQPAQIEESWLDRWLVARPR